MNHTRAHTSLLILAVAVLLVVVAVNFYMRQKVGVSVDHAVLARDIVLAEQQNVANEQGLSQTFQTTVAARSRLHELFIPSDKAVELIEALEGIGTQTGAAVDLAAIAADNLDASAPGTIGSVNVQVTVTGSWSAAMRTLKLVETLPYPVTIGTVSANSSGSGAAGKREWRIAFSVKAPIIKQ